MDNDFAEAAFTVRYDTFPRSPGIDVTHLRSLVVIQAWE